MSNLEHLMENALCLQREIKELDDWDKKEQEFKDKWYNREMAEDENITLTQVWNLASYVTLTWCRSLEWEIEDLNDELSKYIGELSNDSISKTS